MPPRIYSLSAAGKRHEKVPKDAIYVGRPSPYGNKFVVGIDGTRAEVIAKYETWLRGQSHLMRRIRTELRGKDLTCFCSPPLPP